MNTNYLELKIIVSRFYVLILSQYGIKIVNNWKRLLKFTIVVF